MAAAVDLEQGRKASTTSEQVMCNLQRKHKEEFSVPFGVFAFPDAVLSDSL